MKTILFVSADYVFREIYPLLLANMLPFKTLTAEGRDTALHIISTSNVDCLVIDDLIVGDVFDLIRAVRAKYGIPVILLNASGFDHTQQAIMAGASFCLKIPHDYLEIGPTVKKVLRIQ